MVFERESVALFDFIIRYPEFLDPNYLFFVEKLRKSDSKIKRRNAFSFENHILHTCFTLLIVFSVKKPIDYKMSYHEVTSSLMIQEIIIILKS